MTHSIRQDLIRIIVSTLIILLLMAGGLGFAVTDSLSKSIKADLNDFSEQTLSVLNTALSTPQVVLKTATLAPFPQLLHENRPLIALHFLSILKAYPYFVQLIVLDTSGNTLLTVPENSYYTGVNLSQNEWFLQARNSGKAEYSQIDQNYLTGQAELNLVLPLDEGMVLFASLDLDRLVSGLSSISESVTKKISLIESTGTYILHEDHKKVEERQVDMAFLVQKSGSEKQSYTYMESNGEQMRGVVARKLKDMNWYLLVAEENSQAFSPLYFSVFFIVLGLIILLGLEILITLRISRNLWKGIEDMMDFAQIIGAGGHPGKVIVSAYSEFERLSGSLVTMSEMVKQREEIIHRQVKELEQFTYAASHDLKSPLITIQGFLGVMKKDLLAGDQVRPLEDIERVLKAVDRMGALVSDLLELSRIGQIPSSQVPCSMEEIFSEALEMLQGPFSTVPHKIIKETDLPWVNGDKSRLREIWQNLLENSLKYRKPDGILELAYGCIEAPDKWTFYLKDNGIGVMEAYKEKVFGLFEKLNQRSEGTGIGLALVKKIVANYGGTVWLESQGTNMGVTIWFTFLKE